MRPVATRYPLLGTALLALFATFVATGSAGRPSVSFVSAGRAYQGKPYAVAITARAGAFCSLKVRYADGAVQRDLRPTQAINGRARWAWRIPEVAAPGAARLTARCGSASARRTITVVGTLIPPKIVVLKSGWSVRQRLTGATASYGVVLKNTSPNANAIRVSVQVNFVLADNRLIGTATQPIPMINAGQTYYYAGSLQFPGAAPVVKLEFVILVGAREKAQKRPSPALANVMAVAQAYDPSWTAWVQGEVINNQAALTLKNAQLSAVMFDAAGNVVGGTTGSAFNVLPPGTRQVFKLTSGADAVPFAKVASIAVSALPNWETPTR